MPTYRQKLITVEALKFTGENIPEILKFCPQCFQEGNELRLRIKDAGKDLPKEYQSFLLPTGAWVQKNPDGSFAPCSSAFLDFYEQI